MSRLTPHGLTQKGAVSWKSWLAVALVVLVILALIGYFILDYWAQTVAGT